MGMKKSFLSLTVFAASAVYVAYQYLGGRDSSLPTIQTTFVSVIAPAIQPTKSSSSATAIPTPKPQGRYADGTYTGSSADAYYGTVQVQATIQGGNLTDVAFLQYPNDRSTSQYINGQAMPYLRQEAIQAQNANVSGVSGASETSAAFRESLANALAQAKN